MLELSQLHLACPVLSKIQTASASNLQLGFTGIGMSAKNLPNGEGVWGHVAALLNRRIAMTSRMVPTRSMTELTPHVSCKVKPEEELRWPDRM